jgi:hypothetical protein
MDDKFKNISIFKTAFSSAIYGSIFDDVKKKRGKGLI